MNVYLQRTSKPAFIEPASEQLEQRMLRDLDRNLEQALDPAH
ncbi:hypothetical protein [Agromyces cavernae]|nr:hypothetical protein [Agromyces cavernae]